MLVDWAIGTIRREAACVQVLFATFGAKFKIRSWQKEVQLHEFLWRITKGMRWRKLNRRAYGSMVEAMEGSKCQRCTGGFRWRMERKGFKMQIRLRQRDIFIKNENKGGNWTAALIGRPTTTQL